MIEEMLVDNIHMENLVSFIDASSTFTRGNSSTVDEASWSDHISKDQCLDKHVP